MNALIEKKNEFIAKKNEIYQRRQDYIDAKVSEYRNKLEAEPFDESEIVKINKVIAAIDEVLAYESGYPETEPEPALAQELDTSEQVMNETVQTNLVDGPAKAETKESSNGPAKAETKESSRPGMQSFNVDRR